MPEQLAFHLPAIPALGREDFLVAPANANAVAMVSDDDAWPSGKLVLVGPEGAGKTHLVHVWAAERGSRILSARDLAALDVAETAEAGRVALEDVETLADGDAGELPLLHLHNLILQAGGRLLLTAEAPPASWRITLPDLRSRLQSMAVATLSPPDDALLGAVIVKLFADRQIDVTPALVDYLVSRIDRSFAAAREAVDRLDRAALAEGRPVNRSLAARLLDKDAPGGA